MNNTKSTEQKVRCFLRYIWTLLLQILKELPIIVFRIITQQSRQEWTIRRCYNNSIKVCQPTDPYLPRVGGHVVNHQTPQSHTPNPSQLRSAHVLVYLKDVATKTQPKLLELHPPTSLHVSR